MAADPFEEEAAGAPPGGMRWANTTLRMPPGAEAQRAFRSPVPLSPNRTAWEKRAPPVDALDLPHVTECDDSIMHAACCTIVARR
jgi:hypothetical protein